MIYKIMIELKKIYSIMLFARSGAQDVVNLIKDLWPSGKGIGLKVERSRVRSLCEAFGW